MNFPIFPKGQIPNPDNFHLSKKAVDLVIVPVLRVVQPAVTVGPVAVQQLVEDHPRDVEAVMAVVVVVIVVRRKNDSGFASWVEVGKRLAPRRRRNILHRPRFLRTHASSSDIVAVSLLKHPCQSRRRPSRRDPLLPPPRKT